MRYVINPVDGLVSLVEAVSLSYKPFDKALPIEVSISTDKTSNHKARDWIRNDPFFLSIYMVWKYRCSVLLCPYKPSGSYFLLLATCTLETSVENVQKQGRIKTSKSHTMAYFDYHLEINK